MSKFIMIAAISLMATGIGHAKDLHSGKKMTISELDSVAAGAFRDGLPYSPLTRSGATYSGDVSNPHFVATGLKSYTGTAKLITYRENTSSSYINQNGTTYRVYSPYENRLYQTQNTNRAPAVVGPSYFTSQPSYVRSRF